MDNRAHLLDKALALFAARGYDGVGVQEIVESAGVTKPTLYHYFNSKRGLLEALLAERFTPLDAELDRAAGFQGDLVLTLERTARAYFQFGLREPVFYRLTLSLYFASPESEACLVYQPHGDRQQARLEKLFACAAEAHGNLRGRQRAYAASFNGMVNTYIGLFLNGQCRLDDELVYRSVHQFMYGIFA